MKSDPPSRGRVSFENRHAWTAHGPYPSVILESEILQDRRFLHHQCHSSAAPCSSPHSFYRRRLRPLGPRPVRLLSRCTFDHAGIARILPHRFPFLLVDRIIEFEVDKRIVGVKNVSFNDRYLSPVTAGGAPALPPTILTEVIAQVGAIMILAKPENRHRLPFFTGIERAPCLGPSANSQADQSPHQAMDHQAQTKD